MCFFVDGGWFGSCRQAAGHRGRVAGTPLYLEKARHSPARTEW